MSNSQWGWILCATVACSHARRDWQDWQVETRVEAGAGGAGELLEPVAGAGGAGELLEPVASAGGADELLEPVASAGGAGQLLEPVAGAGGAGELLELVAGAGGAGELLELVAGAGDAGELLEPVAGAGGAGELAVVCATIAGSSVQLTVSANVAGRVLVHLLSYDDAYESDVLYGGGCNGVLSEIEDLVLSVISPCPMDHAIITIHTEHWLALEDWSEGCRNLEVL